MSTCHHSGALGDLDDLIARQRERAAARGQEQRSAPVGAPGVTEPPVALTGGEHDPPAVPSREPERTLTVAEIRAQLRESWRHDPIRDGHDRGR